jgi:catechol 2,3-dioxygenase-like lactoylglutathione lyase family enzyme
MENTMPTGIDHIVIAVSDLDTTIADYTTAGFTVTPGGEHKGGASHNALVAFSDGAYFELIAFKGEAGGGGGAPGWRSTLESAGEGLVDYALRTDDLDAEVAALTAAGLHVQGPYDGGRFRPDGQRIDWQIIRFDEPGLPFYCFDVTERSLRVPHGEAWNHANGVTGVERVRFLVADLDAASNSYAALTGAPGGDIEGSGDVARAREFPIGSAFVELVQPAAGGALRETLAARGERPFEIVLTATSGESGTLLPIGLTHGAPLRIQ